ncbi:MAG: hypothetical protein M1820_005256 [Bogoriella megaspora]|nr:MAG: hypothetical protein M1820_005256 [Bogoriella megaspora]
MPHLNCDTPEANTWKREPNAEMPQSTSESSKQGTSSKSGSSANTSESQTKPSASQSQGWNKVEEDLKHPFPVKNITNLPFHSGYGQGK